VDHELINTAIVTGGHSFEIIGFTDLFRELPGVKAYIQHLDDFASASEAVRGSYDAILFYIFYQDEPKDEGQPWWAGKPKTTMEHLGVSGQGLVVMHHALLAYRGWPLWNEIVGVDDRGFGYFPGQHLRIKIADAAHPITLGMQDWEMLDETYTMTDAGLGNHVLLTTDHPRSMHTLAWTRQYKNSRVFCLESGHNNKAYVNPNFKIVLARGIAWAAGRI
jgi:hypothetical protein